MKLEVRGIRKKFQDKEVLKGISFEVESGKALGLLGRNGAGKTTTIRIVMDVFRADEGEILIDGKKFNPREIKIGYLPEERGLYPKKTVLEQMVYLAKLRGISKATAIESSKKWLERLGVSQYENQLLETLSKGNQQKVQLAATLVSDPEIVILDEPFSGLDPVNSQVLQDVVNELIEIGKIVIFSSHQMSYVEQFCKDVVIIDKGTVVLDGNLMEIKREFGEDQIVIEGKDISAEKMSEIVKSNLSDIAKITNTIDNSVIVRLSKDVSSSSLLSRISEIKNFQLERIENYKPSLNDIFVAKVGD